MLWFYLSIIQFFVPKYILFSEAATTADIAQFLNPIYSNLWIASTVVPPGLVTSSFNYPGCYPVSSTILADPKTVYAANFCATSLGSPILTPPSAIASINI